MNQSKTLPHAIHTTRSDMLNIENERLKGQVQNQREQLQQLSRQLSESEERCAHSNAMLRRATRLLGQVVYSQQSSSEVIEEVEQMRSAMAGGEL